MSVNKFSFNIKKPSQKNNNSINSDKTVLNESKIKNVKDIFEMQPEKCPSDVQLRSFVTSLSSKGFTEIVKEDYRKKQLIIKCKNPILLPNHREKQKKSTHPIKYLGAGNILNEETNETKKPHSPKELNNKDVSHRDKMVLKTETKMVEDLSDSDSSLCPDFESIRNWRDLYDQNLIPLDSLDKSSLQCILRSNALKKARQSHTDEKDAFALEIKHLPDFSAASYDSVPVEEFGLATLTGMGYDPKKHNTPIIEFKSKAYVRAGLGADKEFESGK
jgi:hypothetical protein